MCVDVDMQANIGVKLINAKPMTRQEYNDFRGWDLPADENGADEGFLVEYVDGGERNTMEYDGYVSWSPRKVFENAYRPVSGMSFGLAIEAAKKGAKIARVGWNGKNMFVLYQKGYPEGIPCNEQTAAAYGMKVGDKFKCDPYLQMRNVRGSHVMWVASQSDILEDDWMIV